MLNLAGTEAAGALSVLLLGDGNDVDLEVVELCDAELDEIHKNMSNVGINLRRGS